MHRLLREPLLHFLVLGALLFALYGSLHGGGVPAPNVIVLSSAKLATLEDQFTKVWQRPPTQQEMQALVDSWVRDEVFYREGVALGFDRDDPVVRRRIGQKVAFLVEGGTPAPPTAQELQDWLDAHPDDYRIEPTYSLRQVFFDPTRHGDRLEEDVFEALRALSRGQQIEGDSTMLPSELDGAPASDITRVFGSEFTDGLDALPIGSFSGPVRSGFGLHLVDLRARNDGRPATLAEARAAVERDLQHDRTERASEAFYAKLRASYTVRIEGEVGASEGAGVPPAGS
jgi:hypothetical protein